MSRKTEVFKTILEGFETEELRQYCEDMIDKIDDRLFSIPSSTSYKYHNKTQCQPGGHSYHVVMAGTIMNYLLGLEYMKEKFSQPKKRDALRIAILLHDALKINGGQYTVHEHPVLAQKWVEETHVEHDINDKLKRYIGKLIASHSGEWVSSSKSSIVLPKPENDEQFLIHLCDYLSSRSNLDMIYTPEQIEAVEQFIDKTPPDPSKFVFPFGKYKGKSFTEVFLKDENYLLWLRDKADMEIRSPLKELLEDI